MEIKRTKDEARRIIAQRRADAEAQARRQIDAQQRAMTRQHAEATLAALDRIMIRGRAFLLDRLADIMAPQVWATDADGDLLGHVLTVDTEALALAAQMDRLIVCPLADALDRAWSDAEQHAAWTALYAGALRSVAAGADAVERALSDRDELLRAAVGGDGGQSERREAAGGGAQMAWSIKAEQKLADDIRERRRADVLDVREAAEEIVGATGRFGDPQTVRRLLRAGRITITDSKGHPVSGSKAKAGGKGKPWIIPVVDVAHAILAIRDGKFFGGWWATAEEDHLVMRCAGVPTASTIDPKPGLSEVRAAVRDLLDAMREVVDASVLEDVAGE